MAVAGQFDLYFYFWLGLPGDSAFNYATTIGILVVFWIVTPCGFVGGCETWLNLEDVGDTLLRDGGDHQQDYMVSQHKTTIDVFHRLENFKSQTLL
jgi:hypothetical protein